ncbi:hypothetical protein GW17_00058353 [Ensete ventricosum]|nr:hypothetical protein GW17_00058353 [Ensete ventricosum]
MALPGAAGLLTPAAAAAEDPNKKVRKPYTITKSRESWTEQEHDKFLEALQLFDRDWKKIEAFVGSKSVIQIRSHAQKYFLKVQKTGTSEHVPPPRPKRKASHPYPQKAPKNGILVNAASQISQGTTPLQTSCLLEPGYTFAIDTSSTPRSSTANGPMPSGVHKLHPVSTSHLTTGLVFCLQWFNLFFVPQTRCKALVLQVVLDLLEPWWQNAIYINPAHSIHTFSSLVLCFCEVMPDFAQVYSFLGSVFDPSTTGHLQRLKEMDPIDVETVCYLPSKKFTVLLLMRNLSINLNSPDFEAHLVNLNMFTFTQRRVLSSYNDDIEEDAKSGIANNMSSTSETVAPFV